MFLPIVPLKVLTVYGLAESDLGDLAREVAKSRRRRGSARSGTAAQCRSSAAISTTSSCTGYLRWPWDVRGDPNSPEAKKIFKDWLTQRYHAPSDDLNQPVDLSSAAQYEEIIRGLLISVADRDQRPHWKPDSFFQRYAEPAKIGTITAPEALGVKPQ